MVESPGRFAGSTESFETDWQQALASGGQRYLVYPSRTSGRQTDLFEWIKAQQVEALLQEAGIHSGHVLEVGCGAAGMSLFLATRGHRCQVCDISPGSLAVVERNRRLHAPATRLRGAAVADGQALPYDAETFDVVMSYGLLEHFEISALHTLLAETVRVLRPGGLWIADIVPGPQRFNVRTAGLVASYLGSLIAHLILGRFRETQRLHRSYFDYYYESAYDDQAWAGLIGLHSLREVRVDVCRPFPPLALAGAAERHYAQLIGSLLPFHQRFDGANNWLTRRWGWMYLASGRKGPVGE